MSSYSVEFGIVRTIRFHHPVHAPSTHVLSVWLKDESRRDIAVFMKFSTKDHYIDRDREVTDFEGRRGREECSTTVAHLVSLTDFWESDTDILGQILEW